MSVNERMLCMREQLKNICQLGAHGSDDFSRSQTKAIFATTVSLLSEPTVGFCERYSEENNNSDWNNIPHTKADPSDYNAEKEEPVL